MPAANPSEIHAARRILVVDDDPDVADSLLLFVETFGVAVRAAYGGEDALKTFSEFRPELVFLDLGMPGMDGYDTAARLRLLPGGDDVRLVALTGWDGALISNRIRSAGFDCHLTKPAGVEALQKLLHAL